MQSVDQAAADISSLPLREWAGWIIYLLEALGSACANIEGDPKIAFEAITLEQVEDAIMKRLADGAW